MNICIAQTLFHWWRMRWESKTPHEHEEYTLCYLVILSHLYKVHLCICSDFYFAFLNVDFKFGQDIWKNGDSISRLIFWLRVRVWTKSFPCAHCHASSSFVIGWFICAGQMTSLYYLNAAVCQQVKCVSLYASPLLLSITAVNQGNIHQLRCQTAWARESALPSRTSIHHCRCKAPSHFDLCPQSDRALGLCAQID